jgi:hypothetical protein
MEIYFMLGQGERGDVGEVGSSKLGLLKKQGSKEEEIYI